MKKAILVSSMAFAVILFAFAAFSTIAFGQTPSGVKPSVVTGDVVSVSENKIVLQMKDGLLDVGLTDATQFKRVPPENPSLQAAVAAKLADIGEGDKLMVTGIFGADKKVLPARAVYLMTKSDISQKRTKDRERWTTRGLAGRVTTVNTQTQQITVEVRGLMNSTNVVITPKSDTVFRRYAPNSVKYDEAKSSTLTEIQPGDMLRAAGERSADGASFTAEEILTGAFRTPAACRITGRRPGRNASRRC
ncbi:MAG: hypothetical protein LC734_03195 [Acidobacteria bacterium]|nr:hypothetical protein [Acidobacteriota bacterium]